MVHFALFEMEKRRHKRLSIRTQARDLIFKVFNYVKWKRTTVNQCAELCCASESSGFDVADWKWSKRTVTITKYLSQYLTNLMYKIYFTISFISCLYMFRAHVLETCRGMN